MTKALVINYHLNTFFALKHVNHLSALVVSYGKIQGLSQGKNDQTQHVLSFWWCAR